MDRTLPIKEDFISFRDYKVWYRIVGQGEAPGKLPLLCLHGGPGATGRHDARLQGGACSGLFQFRGRLCG